MPPTKAKDDFFECGKPIHKTAYCAFLDVLGFSERIRESYKLGTHDSLLASFHSILGKAIGRLKKDSDGSMLYFKSFTDNVVLAHPGFSDDLESEFGFILWSLREYQFNMACEGFFVRGGLSVGPLFMDETSVYGAALLEAYELESKIAVNPVVALSDDAMKLVDHHMTYYFNERPPQVRDVLRGPNGRYFINYLTEAIYETGHGDKLAVKLLRKHKNNVVAELRKHRKNPRVFEKFAWLAAYHNHFCDQVADFPEYKTSLKVPGKEFSLVFSSISRK
jgi:hypothetical protein